ncbi:MAG: carbohydrate binding family 9 domain-containing protein [bacterium]|nr:carbohydrate binding family 9 domain-containing protein [bacterium]
MKMGKTIVSLLVLLLCVGFIHGKKTEQRVIKAVRSETPIKIDGKLKEPSWQGKGYGDFIQSEPNDGKPATEKTTVWVAYDNDALYVAAKMMESKPNCVLGRLGRRDELVASDWFIFAIDPYYDHRSGYRFAITPSGSIVDWNLFNDESRDSTWDGIWESAVQVHEKGWSVEIRIPYDQLRFKKKDNYLWGVNFERYIKHKNEQSGFTWKPRKDSGYVSHFARLEGIKNIKPRRHIELFPFTVGKADFRPKEEGNPFVTGSDFSANGGMDIKIGLKSNLTLDLTVNPDFGQVEVDPAVINLSASENYYDEKRPFFIEGAGIFRFGRGGSNRNIGANWGNPSFFYSRRIGRPPQGSIDSDGYVQYPEWSTILAAGKITGKVGNNLSIGFLSALTQREYASVDLDGVRSKAEVEPFTYYGVLRVQKEFNDGNQGLGFIATSVFRDLENPELETFLNRSALSFAVDGWTFLDKDNTWVVSGWFGGTHVTGSETAISNLQLSYPHYYQRPDATHITYDPTATSLSGWAGRLSLNKQKGNFIVNAAIGAISPGFDSTDMGFQWNSDVINAHIMLSYRQFKPGKVFRWWSASLFTQRNYDFGGNKIGEQRLICIVNAQLKNYWDLYSQVSYNPARWNTMLTRGGPLALNPSNTWGEIGINSDIRKPIVFSLSGSFDTGAADDYELGMRIGLEWKPKSNFSILFEPDYTYECNTSQWVTNVEDDLMTATYGNRYVFGNIVRKTLVCSIRMNWIFTPKLSLQAYIQPFIAVGDYTDFKELAAPRTYDFNEYGSGNSLIDYDAAEGTYTVNPDTEHGRLFSFGDPDFNYKSLRGTVVLRWEYRPGSAFYAVWTQNRSDYSNPGEFKFGRDFKDLLKARGNNIFMLKFTYRFKL